MAFTRKYLASLGLESDKIEAIMEAHLEVVDGLKTAIAETSDRAQDYAKATAELEQVKKDLQAAQEKIAAAEKDDYKAKYESEKAAHEKLQADIAAKETAAKKEAALTKAAKKEKYSADAIAMILDSKRDYAARIELDADGNATNIAEIMEAIKTDRPNLAPKTVAEKHTPANPPESRVSTTMTWEEIDKIKDDGQRQAAMLANMEALGIK